MLGLGGSLALTGRAAMIDIGQRVSVGSVPARSPIVAWGDSMTRGYVAPAATLFDPPRAIVNRGVGHQSSTAIAARQGGIAITVTLAGNTIPMASRLTWDFSGGSDGWITTDATSAINPSSVSMIATGPDTLRITQSGGVANASARRLLGPATAFGAVADSIVRISATVSRFPNQVQEIGLVNTGNATGAGGAWVTTNRSFANGVRTTLANALATTPANYLALAAWLSGSEAQELLLTQPVVEIATPVAIIEKSINVLFDSGNFTGTISGRLAGIHGVISTDSAGNWSFLRDDFGPAISCPPGSVFVPDEANSLRRHTAWIWSGRNNFVNPASVKTDIAAMVAHLGHSRYLVGSICNGNYESEFAGGANYATLMQLNADLASLYGSRYVDIRSALIAAADPVADAIWITRDTVPASLRTDNIHLNPAGNAIVAREMVAATLARGW
ncbi:hypothetical protein [Devosia faecipullorum]|uniref:hypothetical protein n=1 Tax=Devosia faecipullorum TaxID=2755039 RepID=UPI00187BBAEB|nr:hypothetical protein [Devosia faecipullorum]MBE7731994.1 hypothetical protein [Devosia faecipullorum]